MFSGVATTLAHAQCWWEMEMSPASGIARAVLPAVWNMRGRSQGRRVAAPQNFWLSRAPSVMRPFLFFRFIKNMPSQCDATADRRTRDREVSG